MPAYFPLVPKLKYFNNVVTNLTARAVFVEAIKKYSTMYYPYVIRDRDTADSIAAKYYGSSSYDWLVYMANNIIDPYTEWPKPYLQFQDYIVKKYGSMEAAVEQIEFYRRKPEIAYINIDGTDFDTSNPNLATFTSVEMYDDIRITPDTYDIVDDQINYTAVNAYDYEFELNESRRNIVLIGDAYADSIYRELRDLLNG